MGYSEDRERAYRHLFADVYDDALRFALRRAEPTDAEEAVATAMLVAWRHFERAPKEFDARRAWVFGIVRKTLLNERRGSTRRRALAVRVAEHAHRVHRAEDNELQIVEIRADLASAWKLLTAAQQEVLALAIFEQLDAESAAIALGIRTGTYRVRLSRARTVLRTLLTDTSVQSGPEPQIRQPTQTSPKAETQEAR